VTVGILVTGAVVGAIVLLVALFFQRGQGSFSPRGILRLYLYVGSLAGILALAIGVSSVLNYGIARVAGDDFVYGGAPRVAVPQPPCPPEAVAKGCVNPTPEQLERARTEQQQQLDRRRDEDLIRGLTFAVFGGLFWAAHWGARRRLGEDETAGSALRRGYLMLGTGVFGLGTIVLLPTGVYQALANAILRTPDNVFRPGADALGGGIVSLPIWLIYLRLAVMDLRRGA
jgi:drug/metabolite transporter (DMT)-like permease